MMFRLILAGFLGALGVIFLLLGCVLTGVWWTLLLFLFYMFTPIPLLFVSDTSNYQSFDMSESNKGMDVAVFLVAGMVVSTIAFPLVLLGGQPDAAHIDVKNAVFAELCTLLLYATGGIFMLPDEDSDGLFA